MARPFDAIFLECRLGLSDGSLIAETIKQIRPANPIVMVTDNLEIPDGALKSVDAFVTKTDGAHFLLATVHFLMTAKPTRPDASPRSPRQVGRSIARA
jgi:hypothetical protein